MDSGKLRNDLDLIDISYVASEGVPGESRKRQLKKAVISSMESLGFSVTNLEETRSRRSYNCYRAGYPSIYSPLLELKPELLIETYIALLPFPTVNRMADNYIYRFLKKIVDKEIYRQDYESITGKLLFTYVPYETVISGVKEIINKGYFSDI